MKEPRIKIKVKPTMGAPKVLNKAVNLSKGMRSAAQRAKDKAPTAPNTILLPSMRNMSSARSQMTEFRLRRKPRKRLRLPLRSAYAKARISAERKSSSRKSRASIHPKLLKRAIHTQRMKFRNLELKASQMGNAEMKAAISAGSAAKAHLNGTTPSL